MPELEGKRHGKKITDLIQRGQQILVQAVEGPDEDEGRAADDRDLAARPVPRLRPERRGPRRLAPARGRRAPAAQGHPQGDRAGDGRRDRAHRGRGRLGGGRRARPRLPPAALEDDPGTREGREGARPRLPGGGAAAADRPRPVRGRLRRRARRLRPHVQADRRLPEEDLAAHGRARPPRRRRRSRSSSASASRRRSRRRSTAASTSPPAAT